MHLDRRILDWARREGRDLFLTVGLGVVSGTLVVGQAYYLSEIIERVFLLGSSLERVRPLLWTLLVFAVARAAAGWGSELLAQRAAGRVKIGLRTALTEHLLALGPTYVQGERTGELTNMVVGGVESLDAYVSEYLPRLAVAALLPFLILAFVFANDPMSGLILLATAPLIPFFMVLIGNSAKERTRRQWLTLSRMSAHFLDVLQGLTTLKISGRSRDQAEVIRSRSEKFHQTTMGVLKVAFLSSLVLEMTATIGTALVAVGVGLRLLYGRLEFQESLFVLILAPELYRPLRSLGSAFHAGMPGSEAAKRIFSVLDKPVPRTAHVGDSSLRFPVHGVDIELDDVSFSYEEGKLPVLEGVSFTLPGGRKTALVGPIGSGKTTVARLLLRFVEPDRGTIRVGGRSLSEIDPHELRRHVSWVPQFPHLFHATVEENIRLAREDATRDEVVHAAQLARAHDFIEALPQGYSTPIGERGARLSGGERQRIALARAFLKDAPLLILDEPTCELDPELEALIQNAIENLMEGRTVLLIAHRLSTVFNLDQIILLSAGRVIERGTHAGLMASGRLYPRLVEAYGAYR